MIKYVRPVIVYKIVDPHNYLLRTLDGRILRGLIEHERLKPANTRASHGKCPKSCSVKTNNKYGT